MRIIAGERKGFALATPKGKNTRPTLGRVRESLFSILGSRVIDSRVADLYAGTGALGLEALSRGAAQCDFVEKAHSALGPLRQNISKLRYEDVARVAAEDVHRWLGKQNEFPYEIVFLDPPYAQDLAAKALQKIGDHPSLGTDALIVAQTGNRDVLAEEYGRMRLFRKEKYGDTTLHFFLSIAPPL